MSVLLSLFVFLPVLSALEIPKRPDGYVTDRAGLLSVDKKWDLESRLRAFENATSNQIVVVTFPSLETESLEDFSIRLAQAWKPGQKGRDNGVILLIFKQERKIRIEVGYGLEGVLPDALAGQIIRNEIAPHFKKKEYDLGISAGVEALMQATQGAYQPQRPSRGSSDNDLVAGVLLMIFHISWVLFLIDGFRYGRYRLFHRQYSGRFTFGEWFFRFAFLLVFFRILMEILIYSRGGYSSGSGGGSSGGGGFSGGGGSFGGGGASGGW